MGKGNDQEEIDRYVNRKMDEQERAAFEQKMKMDAKLAEETRFQMQLAETIVFKNLLDNAIGQFEEKSQHKAIEKEKKSAKFLRLNKGLAIAASITMLIIVAGLFWVNQNFSYRSLAALDFQKLEIVSDVRSNNEIVQELLDAGSAAIQQQEYRKAEDMLNSIPQEHTSYYLSQLYLGFLQYAQNNYADAKTYADRLLDHQDIAPKYRDRAEWLKLKSLLAEKEVEKAHIILDKILQEPSHVFYEDARQLQRSLNSFWRKLAF